MTENAGERLFEAIGQIPDKMVLEAAQEQPFGQDADRQIVGAAVQQETDAGADGNTGGSTNGSMYKSADMKQPRGRILAVKLGGYLKYLPAAACLCIALGSAGYVADNFIHMNKSADINASGSFEEGAVDVDADGAQEQMDMTMDDAASGDSAGMAESAQQYDGGEGAAPENAAGGVQGYEGGSKSDPKAVISVYSDAYAGPVFPLTATGDTQKLKASRSLKGMVDAQALLHVTDVYKIKNTAKEDKTVQLVYPFVTTLNQALDMDGRILEIEGEEQAAAYCIGESIRAYRNADASEPVSIKDYQQIFNGRTQYQQQALAKAADWDKKVQVYTFSNMQIEADADAGSQDGVIGVTVKGEKANVLTYGFDHSFKTGDSSTNHCFFLPQEEKKLLLIVTGEQDGEPEIGYYANLDCEERIDGMHCEMHRQEMSYADALRLCSNEAARNLRQDYGQGAWLPEYMNEDAAFAALTMIGEEDGFYDALVQRCRSTELTEVYEQLFGETRVVYAMATVTIPAKQSVRAVVRTQKRWNDGDAGNAEMDVQIDADGGVRYDFFSGMRSRLQIQKTAVSLKLAERWQAVEQNMGLKQKKGHVWKGELDERDYYFEIGQ